MRKEFVSVGVIIFGDNTISVRTTLLRISCLVATICQSCNRRIIRLVQIKLFQGYIIGIIENVYEGAVFCNCLSARLSVSLANAPSFDTTCSRDT
jgi:hypothetical protein